MDKINELVNQLQEECEKNNVHLLVSVTFENGLCHVASCGSGAGAYINFMNIKKATAKAMAKSPCDCEACELARNELGLRSKRKVSEKPHIHVVDMSGDNADIDSILKEIFGGDD